MPVNHSLSEVKPKHLTALNNRLRKLEAKSKEEVKKLKAHIKSLEQLIKKEVKSELTKIKKALNN